VVVREDKKLLTVLFPDGRDGRAFTLKIWFSTLIVSPIREGVKLLLPLIQISRFIESATSNLDRREQYNTIF
jgi:hypothetical protein